MWMCTCINATLSPPPRESYAVSPFRVDCRAGLTTCYRTYISLTSTPVRRGALERRTLRVFDVRNQSAPPCVCLHTPDCTSFHTTHGGCILHLLTPPQTHGCLVPRSPPKGG